MKNYFLFLIVILFFGCTEGDETFIDETLLYGTYSLSNVFVAQAQDYNQDGIYSQNLINEVNCFSQSLLVLNENNTFILDSKGVDLSSTNQIVCFVEPQITGTWFTQQGKLYFSFQYFGNTITEEYLIETNNLKFLSSNTEIPNTLSLGVFKFYTTTVQYLYQKN